MDIGCVADDNRFCEAQVVTKIGSTRITGRFLHTSSFAFPELVLSHAVDNVVGGSRKDDHLNINFQTTANIPRISFRTADGTRQFVASPIEVRQQSFLLFSSSLLSEGVRMRAGAVRW